MLTEVPWEISTDIAQFFIERNGSHKLMSFNPVGGGSINQTGRIATDRGFLFLKWNERQRYPGMLSAEAKGLFLLAKAEALKIPRVITTGETERFQYLLLEYIPSKPKNASYWKDFAAGLAKLHQGESALYGLEYNNYIGTLQQSNRQCGSWIEFFIRQRLEPQVRMARNKGLIANSVVNEFHSLYKKLESSLPEEPASLIHGDLWNGNLMTDDNGSPCLIDPAVYYGHREMDIAMTRLFGGFDRAFYSSYNSILPMTSGWEERMDLYNLYPLLVHVNLFGGSYISQLKTSLKRFC